MGNRTCSIDGCERKHEARGWCATHYQRYKVNGTPVISKPTPEERFWSKVDKSGDCWVWIGALQEKGYGHFRGPDGRTVRAHRFSYQLVHGEVLAGLGIDHICHNRQCVRPDHLRAVTQKQNLENRSGAQPSNPTGTRGVSWSKNAGKWHAQVGHYGRNISCGYFDSIEDAEAAVIAKRLELFTHNDKDRSVA